MAETIETNAGDVDLPSFPNPSITAPLPAPSAAAPAPLPAAPHAPLPPPAPVAAPTPVAPAEPATVPTGLTTGPSALFSADTALLPADHAAPTLPAAAPATPSAPATNAAAFDVSEYLEAQTTTRIAKSNRTSPGRWIARLIMLGMLGGAVWLGVQHGPALYDEHIRQDQASATPEVEAPLAFPNATSPVEPIRTAEFILAGLPETPDATYRVTTDFETSVSQVDITRPNAPDLQILTFADDAMIRRADGTQWYLVDRGQFPLDGRLERTDWIRSVDELLPAETRRQAVIDAATESTVFGVPTRRLVITVDPTALASAPVSTGADPEQPQQPEQPEPPVASTAPVPASSVTPASPVPPAAPTTQIEVWVDGNGLIRQVTGAPQLGAQTITVVTTSAEAWIPEYPTPAEIAPLTASALVDLGI